MSLKDNYNLLVDFSIFNNTINIQKWVNKSTKFTVYNVKTQGPISSCYTFVPTETLSNDGLPHTLEHLVFLGSEQYPYKGVLDQISSKCFADGTNAWTDTDHTCYTLSTVGSDGLLNAVPLYMDHIFYPTLTEQGFVTEVHHINGQGKDGGVVYCEMQEVEVRKGTIVCKALSDNIFTKKCSVQSETGGVLADIRELKNETIRKYHKSYYRPDNAAVMIFGDIEIENVFKALEPIEKKFQNTFANVEPMVRPFSEPLEFITENKTVEIQFPSEDLSTGEFLLAWKGASALDTKHTDAISILFDYLTYGSSSPIGSEMIDIDEPFAVDASYHNFEYSVGISTLFFSNSNLKRINEIHDKFFDIIKNIVESKSFDLSRMRDILLNTRHRSLAQLEKSAKDLLANNIIKSHIYNDGSKSLDQMIDYEHFYDDLLKKDQDYWLDLLETQILNNPCLTVKGLPSQEEASRLVDQENQRVEKQISSLGEAKIKELGEYLEQCKTFNDRPADPAIIANIQTPSADSISFFSIDTVINDKPVNGTKQEETLSKYLVDSNATKIPFSIQFDHISSPFIVLNYAFPTFGLDDSLRPYLSLFCELLFKCSTLDSNNNLLSHDQVDALLLKNNIEPNFSISNSKGYNSGSFNQFCFLDLSILAENYESTVELIKNLFKNLVFDIDRIKMVVSQFLDGISDIKNDGQKVQHKSLRLYHFINKQKSNLTYQMYIREEKFLNSLMNILGNDDDDDDDEEEGEDHCCNHNHNHNHDQKEKEKKELTDQELEIIEKLEKVKEYFNRAENMIVQVAGDIYKLKSPKDIWIKQYSHIQSNGVASIPSFESETTLFNNPSDINNNNMEMVVMPSGSSFMTRSTKINFSFDNCISREYAAAILSNSYLDQMEGPFWKGIRGAGYSYGYSLSINLDYGLLDLNWTRASNPVKCIQACTEIANEIINSPTVDQNLFECAKGSLVHDYANRYRNISRAISQSFYDSIRGWHGKGNYKQLIKFILDTKKEEMQSAMNNHLKPFFNNEKSCYFSFAGDKISANDLKTAYPNLVIVDPDTHFLE
ncbi:hypothetical protein CYY_008979 [Polysphondylium violaceum]|uniref:Peptidase M16C associated domain-containing protein n=1 Tax=Polysphondylium violaceum TaxID=133409 RepID=A0A8J4PKW5_9MYCE|nr:hypothetical protein CYY_008979 [Polysphondylium violaceum]